MGECRQEELTSLHHPRRWNVTTSMVGLKTVTYTKNLTKMVNPRDIAGNAEEEAEDGMWLGIRWLSGHTHKTSHKRGNEEKEDLLVQRLAHASPERLGHKHTQAAAHGIYTMSISNISPHEYGMWLGIGWLIGHTHKYLTNAGKKKEKKKNISLSWLDHMWTISFLYIATKRTI